MEPREKAAEGKPPSPGPDNEKAAESKAPRPPADGATAGSAAAKTPSENQPPSPTSTTEPSNGEFEPTVEKAEGLILRWTWKKLPPRLRAPFVVVIAAALLCWGAVETFVKWREIRKEFASPIIEMSPVYEDPSGMAYFLENGALRKYRAVPHFIRQMHMAIHYSGDPDGIPKTGSLIEPLRATFHNPGKEALLASAASLRVVAYSPLREPCVVVWKPKGMKEAERVDISLDPATSSHPLWSSNKFLELAESESSIVIANIVGGVPGTYTLAVDASFKTAADKEETVISGPPIDLLIPLSSTGNSGGCLSVISGGPGEDLPIALLNMSAEKFLALKKVAGPVGLQLHDDEDRATLLRIARGGDPDEALAIQKKKSPSFPPQ